MAAAAPPWRCNHWRWLLVVIFFLYALDHVRAQNATVDPLEAEALTALFARWDISSRVYQWNISGRLCNGVAIDTNISINDINPGIKCDCSFNMSTVCHITHLRVDSLNVTGSIPDELWSLTYLTSLNLAGNYLRGRLSPSIGNLIQLESLTIGTNALSGELPRELGLLTELRTLTLGPNNFSGPLPSELGNLIRLEQLYLNSAGINGSLPQTFANLRSLRTVWAMDNEFRGQIPDYMGSWTNLTELLFEGNSFQGSIPESFSNLTNLIDLRITELSNGGSSMLAILRNMTSLQNLVLRNNNISGSVPSYFGEFQSLILLDLSFNNLTGAIPNSIFNLTSLIYLFLGNNKLSGELPTQKSQNLQNIDLSYNELLGSFPTWITTQNLQINLVANNFNISNSNNSGLPSGLYCLQKSFPCNQEPPIYSSFAINCGGPQITSSDDITYEADDITLGPASYNMINTGRWAVSNAGMPLNTNDPRYIGSSSSSQFTNTSDPVLFQTNRLSAGSLRYYGLHLRNGNYTVRLQFAETAILGGIGRRVFNVYIQGNLQRQDFDIRKEADGVNLRAVALEYTAEVLENRLEVHLFWSGKGTCCVPNGGTYGPLISAISASSIDSEPSGGRNRTGLIAGIIAAIASVFVLAFISLYIIFRRRKKQREFENRDLELFGIDNRPITFSYAELKDATSDFNPANKLGEGGFGPVYKGTLGDGRVVAVKQLSVTSHQGKNQFIAEIATTSSVQHRNLVKLFGCCIEGDKRLLVYEYLENKSLDKLLFKTGSSNIFLNWTMRFDICLGVARGLAYLHEESRHRIIHRDVKASNILLDSSFTPKIADFGLAKLYDESKTHISTNVIAGTYGYLAPEYAIRGHLTEKIDVFSFGVVAMEIVSGRPNSDTNLQNDKKYLLEWAWNLHKEEKDIELLDQRLLEYDPNEVIRIIGVALLCTQASPALRPTMPRVVAMLSGDVEVASITSGPGYLTDWMYNDVTTSMSNTHSSTLDAPHVDGRLDTTTVTSLTFDRTD